MYVIVRSRNLAHIVAVNRQVMKTHGMILLLVASFIESSLLAQIPNNGFEEWLDYGTHLSPLGWWTTNDSTISGDYYPITRSEDHFPEAIGSYSLRIANNIDLLPDWAAYGVAWTGDVTGSDNPAFRVTGHPNSLWGYFKFYPENGDTFEIHARLYSDGVDISGGSFKYSGTTVDWTPFQVVFSEYEKVDSGRIFMSSCYDKDEPNPHGNSVLYIDNLSFDNVLTNISILPDYMDNLLIYPVPANDVLYVKNQMDDWYSANVSIYYSNGQLATRRLITLGVGPQNIDISMLPDGLYMVSVVIDNIIFEEQRVVIAR